MGTVAGTVVRGVERLDADCRGLEGSGLGDQELLSDSGFLFRIGVEPVLGAAGEDAAVAVRAECMPAGDGQRPQPPAVVA